MARFICHHNGRYNIYNSISDGFTYPFGQSLEELTFEIREEFGQQGVDQLPPRLERAHKKGCSAFDEDEDLESLLICNRAGPNMTYLPFNEIIEKFFS